MLGLDVLLAAFRHEIEMILQSIVFDGTYLILLKE